MPSSFHLKILGSLLSEGTLRASSLCKRTWNRNRGDSDCDSGMLEPDS